MPATPRTAELVSQAGTPVIAGVVSPAGKLEVPEKGRVGAATAGGILPRLEALEVAWFQETQAGLPRVRLTVIECGLSV
jgi:hypothetical protein